MSLHSLPTSTRGWWADRQAQPPRVDVVKSYLRHGWTVDGLLAFSHLESHESRVQVEAAVRRQSSRAEQGSTLAHSVFIKSQLCSVIYVQIIIKEP